MRSSRVLLLLIVILVATLLGSAAEAQRRGRSGGARQPQSAPPIEFLGWDYAKLGYTLTPGEEMALLFRNNRQSPAPIPVAWELTTYVGKPLSQGQKELRLEPGETGQVPIPLPLDLKEGAYFIKYTLGSGSQGRERHFYFDFRRPVPDEVLNLRLVALTENMDAEGWTRMMLGPLGRYVNVLSDWPNADQPVDAILVVAETMEDGDPRLARLKSYVEHGGRMLLFGKPAPSLHEILPVQPETAGLWMEKPQRLRTRPGGPWQEFRPEEGPTRYGLRIKAKANATILADWEDGSPATSASSARSHAGSHLEL